MTIPAKVSELIERFERNIDVYKRPDYKEARVRVEFVDPFFEALGWDVRNVQGYAEQYKDAVHEDAIKVGGVVRARAVRRVAYFMLSALPDRGEGVDALRGVVSGRV